MTVKIGSLWDVHEARVRGLVLIGMVKTHNGVIKIGITANTNPFKKYKGFEVLPDFDIIDLDEEL